MSATTFITDDKGNRISAVVPIKKFKHLLELAEELEDVKAYDKAMKGKKEFIPLEEALKQIEITRKEKIMYKVVIERQAMKQLARIPEPYNKKIVAALQDLAEEPRPHGFKKLKGRPGFRIRIGNYRVIYNIQDNVLTVYILLIGDRKDIYE